MNDTGDVNKQFLKLKLGPVKYDIQKMMCKFSFGCFQIYKNKSAKSIAIHFIGTIVPIKCMPKTVALN